MLDDAATESAVREAVVAAGRRIRQREAVVLAVHGTLLASAVLVTRTVVGSRWPVRSTWAFVGVLIAPVLIGVAFGLVARGRAVSAVARLADQALGSQERLSTALEFAGSHGDVVKRQRTGAEEWVAAHSVIPNLGPRVRRAEVLVLAGFLLVAAVLASRPDPRADRIEREHAEARLRGQVARQAGLLAQQVEQGRPGFEGLQPQSQALAGTLRRVERALMETQDMPGAIDSLSSAQDTLARAADLGIGIREQGSSAARNALSQALAGSGINTGTGEQSTATASLEAHHASVAGEVGRRASASSTMNQGDRNALAQALAKAADAAAADPELAQRLAATSAAIASGDKGKVDVAVSALDEGDRALARDSQFRAATAAAVSRLQTLKAELTAPTPSSVSAAGARSSPCGMGHAGSHGAPTSVKQTGAPAPAVPDSRSGMDHGCTSPESGAPQGLGGAGAGGGSGKGPAAGTGQGQGQDGHRGGGGPDGGANGVLEGRPGEPSEQVFVPGMGGPGRSLDLPGAGPGPATTPDLVPYERIYEEYRSEALRQTDRELIPSPLQDLVRQYFRTP